MDNSDDDCRRPITWERLTAIFKNAQPPREVWERQFDYCDAELQKLARTPHEEMDLSDLWYYHHDLAYVELQPELFAYLFPACLMDWHLTLQANKACSHEDSEFHYGLYHGKVLEKMTSPYQQRQIYKFFKDSLLERIDQESSYQPGLAASIAAHGWIFRFNSLGYVMPRIDRIWNAWWSLETPGQAVAALQYLSGLMYFEGDNPLFPPWTPSAGGGGPYLLENDSYISYDGWLAENVEFLATNFTLDFACQKIAEANERLKREPFASWANQLLQDLSKCGDLMEIRIQELPRLLSDANAREWTL